MNERLIKKTITLSLSNYEYISNSPGVSFSDKLRRLLDEIEKQQGRK